MRPRNPMLLIVAAALLAAAFSPRNVDAKKKVQLALSTAVGAADGLGTKFGKPESGNGIASPEGSVRKPRGISLRVDGTTGLIVTVTTVVGCRGPGGKLKEKDGAFNAVAPFTRRIDQTLKGAVTCRVSVVASYEQGSEDLLTAQLFARKLKQKKQDLAGP